MMWFVLCGLRFPNKRLVTRIFFFKYVRTYKVLHVEERRKTKNFCTEPERITNLSRNYAEQPHSNTLIFTKNILPTEAIVMARKTTRTPPFLIKLQTICATLPEDIGHWNGGKFDVVDEERFFEFLKGFYSGTPKTFFRQLSYFRFIRQELLPKGFSFMHQDFQKDGSCLSSIKRATLLSAKDDSSHSTTTSILSTSACSTAGAATHTSPNLAGSSKHEIDEKRLNNLENCISDIRARVKELNELVLVSLNKMKRGSDSSAAIADEIQKKIHKFDSTDSVVEDMDLDGDEEDSLFDMLQESGDVSNE